MLAAWLVGLVAFFAIGGSVGTSYNSNFSMPGTGSTKALNVLKADFPAQSGDSEQVVVRAKEGTLRTPAVQRAVTSMLGQVRRLPHVVSVASPYSAPGQLSRDAKTGFARVNLDASAQDVPKAAVRTLISTAQSADSSRLEATRQICNEPFLSQVRVVILTTFALDEYLFDALRYGASGFVLKDSEPEDLETAVRVVAQGDSLISPAGAT